MKVLCTRVVCELRLAISLGMIRGCHILVYANCVMNARLKAHTNIGLLFVVMLAQNP